MKNHTKSLVPIEVWSYSSPELTSMKLKADIGLFIESLLYYDTVFLNISHPQVFCELLNWFIKQNSYKDLLNLFDEGVIKIYDYSFISTAIDKDGIFSLWNIHDKSQSEPNSYERRILYSREVKACLPKSRHRAALYKALRNNIIEVKADQFGNAIENARQDIGNIEKNNILMQSFVNHIYKIKKLGKPPIIQTSITIQKNGNQDINYNVNFDKLSESIGKEIGFNKVAPLTAVSIANRLIQSASDEKCDLYLSSPMSTIVGNKLYESNLKIAKASDVIKKLKIEAEFPDIRALVNSNQINFQDVITIRKEASKFRVWLQSEGERDRNAIIAYHNEVSKKMGLSKSYNNVIDLFGVLGGGAVGSVVGAELGGVIGGTVGAGIPYLIDIVSKINDGWKPIVFGEWLSERVKKNDEV